MMLEDEDEGPQVSFEPFQLSDQCMRLYNGNFFHETPSSDAKMTKLTKEVIMVRPATSSTVIYTLVS